MARCVLVTDDGATTVTDDTPQAYQGYLILTSGEYQNATMSYRWMQAPSQADMVTVFVMAFGLVATPYLVACTIGRLVAMFNDQEVNHERQYRQEDRGWRGTDRGCSGYNDGTNSFRSGSVEHRFGSGGRHRECWHRLDGCDEDRTERDEVGR